MRGDTGGLVLEPHLPRGPCHPALPQSCPQSLGPEAKWTPQTLLPLGPEGSSAPLTNKETEALRLQPAWGQTSVGYCRTAMEVRQLQPQD